MPFKTEQWFHSGANLDHYDAEYARKYIERTLEATYTKYKNKLLAEKAAGLGLKKITDIGGNVSGILRVEGSLRYQLEKKGIAYAGVDLIPEYFDPESARNLNIPEENIYKNVEGYVADIEKLPFEDDSIEGLVCADVIEHVPNPRKAFRELARVLKKGGNALMIIPSMYKLDLFDFDYIEQKRSSSHESKLIIDDWEKMWSDAGLEIDSEASRAIGIASGLSYLSWIDDEIVPERPDLDSKEEYSPKSIVHKMAKEVLGKHDEAIDAYIFLHDLDSELVELIKNKDMKGALFLLEEIIYAAVDLSREEKKILDVFFQIVRETSYSEERLTYIAETFKRSKTPKLLLGNAVLAVLRHKAV